MNNDRSVDYAQMKLYTDRKNRVKNQGKDKRDEDEDE